MSTIMENLMTNLGASNKRREVDSKRVLDEATTLQFQAMHTGEFSPAEQVAFDASSTAQVLLKELDGVIDSLEWTRMELAKVLIDDRDFISSTLVHTSTVAGRMGELSAMLALAKKLAKNKPEPVTDTMCAGCGAMHDLKVMTTKDSGDTDFTGETYCSDCYADHSIGGECC